MKTVIGGAVVVHAKLRAALREAEIVQKRAAGMDAAFQRTVARAVEDLNRCLEEWHELSKPVELAEIGGGC